MSDTGVKNMEQFIEYRGRKIVYDRVEVSTTCNQYYQGDTEVFYESKLEDNTVYFSAPMSQSVFHGVYTVYRNDGVTLWYEIFNFHDSSVCGRSPDTEWVFYSKWEFLLDKSLSDEDLLSRNPDSLKVKEELINWGVLDVSGNIIPQKTNNPLNTCRRITQEELDYLIEQHGLLLETDYPLGNWLDLNNTDCSGLDFSFKNLASLNFKGVNLTGANLEGALIIGARGNDKEIKNITHLPKYQVTYTKDTLAIGCQQHSLDEWEAFSDERIEKMDDGALEWWKTHKEEIMAIVKNNKE